MIVHQLSLTTWTSVHFPFESASESPLYIAAYM